MSRDELKQFVRSSRMAKLDDTEFDTLFSSIDTDHNGEVAFGKIVSYFDSLHESTKEDFCHSVAKFLKNGSNEEVAALWSKLDLNYDGVVSLAELTTVVSSKKIYFFKQTNSLPIP